MFDGIKRRIFANVILKYLRKDKKMMKWLEGKKTILTCAVIAVLGAIDSLNGAGLIHFSVPDWVFIILGGLGIYTRRIAKP